MALTLHLPIAGGALAPYTLQGRVLARPPAGLKFNRIAYSAAHVVADPMAAAEYSTASTMSWKPLRFTIAKYWIFSPVMPSTASLVASTPGYL